MDTLDWIRQVPSDRSAGETYTVQRQKGLYSCSCLAWRMQRSPIHLRTCKHLIRVLGADHEKQRAPESFYGLTRAKRGHVPPEPIPFMSFHTWNPQKLPPERLEHWLYSIKLNGAFGRWADGRLVTKSGRELHPPAAVTAQLPRDLDLDGEIYHPDRQKVRLAVLADQWNDDVAFVVFDVFNTVQPFGQRWKTLQTYHERWHFPLVVQHVFRAADWPRLETAVRDQKEEGLVLRDPQGLYQTGPRSRTTLKWKPWSTGRARVEAVQPLKRGTRLTLRESHHEAVFRVFSRQAPEHWAVGQEATFKYAGRDERERPELARLLPT